MEKMEKNGAQSGLERLLLTSKEAAELIGVKENYLRQCRMTGTIGGGHPAPPYRQMGRTIRYELTALRAWVEALPERRFVSTAESKSGCGEMSVRPTRLNQSISQ